MLSSRWTAVSLSRTRPRLVQGSTLSPVSSAPSKSSVRLLMLSDTFPPGRPRWAERITGINLRAVNPTNPILAEGRMQSGPLYLEMCLAGGCPLPFCSSRYPERLRLSCLGEVRSTGARRGEEEFVKNSWHFKQLSLSGSALFFSLYFSVCVHVIYIWLK